ncbi:hypothetical protein HYV71_04990 [Candidatus Uhrbacteria bacterium]|nr:hypothetical protein [Candidatus Uhrbacteria bacterium]
MTSYRKYSPTDYSLSIFRFFCKTVGNKFFSFRNLGWAHLVDARELVDRLVALVKNGGCPRFCVSAAFLHQFLHESC